MCATALTDCNVKPPPTIAEQAVSPATSWESVETHQPTGSAPPPVATRPALWAGVLALKPTADAASVERVFAGTELRHLIVRGLRHKNDGALRCARAHGRVHGVSKVIFVSDLDASEISR